MSSNLSASGLAPRMHFEDADQRRFAAYSGDRNPIHMDAIAARRTLTGRQIVHGVHTLLQALERYAAKQPARPNVVSCSFTQPVSVGDEVDFTQDQNAEGRITLRAVVRGLACTEVEIDPVEPQAGSRSGSFDTPGGGPLRRLPELAAPLDEAPEAQRDAMFELPVADLGLASEFPRAAALFGAAGVAALGKLSYFVGMVCPGLHSVFSSLKFSVGSADQTTLRFRVQRWDPRFRLFTVAFSGPLVGELRAFQRPKPQPQPTAAEAAAAIQPGEFESMRALVLGGSRGLGEISAKLICGGGGRAWITYAAGKDDAYRVAEEINAEGRQVCQAIGLDLMLPFAGVPGLDASAVNSVFYFATPQIYAKRNTVYSSEAFGHFVTFYVERFHELCLWLEAAPGSSRTIVYLPSTVAIDERPKGMTEYAMVKAATEQLAIDLNRSLSRVRVVLTRLPRLATDQTATILNPPTESNVQTMVAVVRKVADALRRA